MILDEAKKLVEDDRQEVYGHPADNFARIAQMTKPIMESDIDPRLKHALYMNQVKVARLLDSPDHHDSLVDIVGYVLTYEKVIEREGKNGIIREKVDKNKHK